MTIILRQGVSLIPLYKDNREQVSVFFMEPGAKLSLSVEQGIELLVIQGSVDVSDNSKNQLFQHSWMRLSAAGALEARAQKSGLSRIIWPISISKLNELFSPAHSLSTDPL